MSNYPRRVRGGSRDPPGDRRRIDRDREGDDGRPLDSDAGRFEERRDKGRSTGERNRRDEQRKGAVRVEREGQRVGVDGTSNWDHLRGSGREDNRERARDRDPSRDGNRTVSSWDKEHETVGGSNVSRGAERPGPREQNLNYGPSSGDLDGSRHVRAEREPVATSLRGAGSRQRSRSTSPRRSSSLQRAHQWSPPPPPDLPSPEPTPLVPRHGQDRGLGPPYQFSERGPVISPVSSHLLEQLQARPSGSRLGLQSSGIGTASSGSFLPFKVAVTVEGQQHPFKFLVKEKTTFQDFEEAICEGANPPLVSSKKFTFLFTDVEEREVSIRKTSWEASVLDMVELCLKTRRNEVQIKVCNMRPSLGLTAGSRRVSEGASGSTVERAEEEGTERGLRADVALTKALKKEMGLKERSKDRTVQWTQKCTDLVDVSYPIPFPFFANFAGGGLFSLKAIVLEDHNLRVSFHSL
jgi:hypothetical protein